MGLLGHRLLKYMEVNLFPSIYYDKIYTKAYLPSRIRYNQFFFYSCLAFFGYGLLSKSNGGGSFCPMEESEDLSKRVYYSSDRPVINLIAR